ncbi:hypothetical protein C8R43DRAFT_953368 [Mycena crocata]|nr:hypothetical protein C8R43DRAFT_953368 [Mycena crocata]
MYSVRSRTRTMALIAPGRIYFPYILWFSPCPADRSRHVGGGILDWLWITSDLCAGGSVELSKDPALGELRVELRDAGRRTRDVNTNHSPVSLTGITMACKKVVSPKASHHLRRSPRKHTLSTPKKQKNKKGKQAAEGELGPIPWAANDAALSWAVVNQMQVKDNRLVLFGKNPGTNEGTKGDSKTIVYKRIGAEILPDIYKTHPNTLGKRVKGKAEDNYKFYAKKLQVTGGGLDNDQDDDSDVHEFLECYISPEGCNMTTAAQIASRSYGMEGFHVQRQFIDQRGEVQCVGRGNNVPHGHMGQIETNDLRMVGFPGHFRLLNGTESCGG